MAVFDELLIQYPTSDLVDDMQYMLGQCYVRTERDDEAIFAFYTTAYTYPWSNRADDALMALAGVLYNENYIPQALDAYEQLVGKYPQSKHAAYAQTCIGWLYGGMENPERAKVELEKVAMNYPNSLYVNTAQESIAFITKSTSLVKQQTSSTDENIQSGTTNFNKLPVVNFDVNTVSGGSFEAPVWLKFYPSGTYDPDGKIKLFEMDMDGDGIYDVIESTLAGGSAEFTMPGKYTAIVRVTDDNGGITTKSKSFTIIGSDYTYTEPLKTHQPVEKRKPENVELDKKLDTIIEEYKSENKQPTKVIKEPEVVYQKPVQKIEKPNQTKQDINIEHANIPLTTAKMYDPDSLVKRGRWATAVDISKDKTFNGKTTINMEPGFEWTNGMFAHPGDWGPTEMIYYHDGSNCILKGIVSVLDCVDYCASLGDCGFMIKGDDKELWHSSIVKQHDEPVGFNVALKGINKLTLITNDGGDGTYEDWSIWMDLEVLESIDKANLIVNGSFEEGLPFGSFKLFSKGDGIPGWKVTRATVDLVGDYFRSADGNNSIDLNGTSYGELQQQFSTKKGKQYKLSFYLAGNPGGGPTIKKLLVAVGNKSEEYQFDISGRNVKEMGWEYHELIFTAKDKSTILTFESNHKSGPAAAGPVIDNVSVIEIETKDVVEETQTSQKLKTDKSTIKTTADSYVYEYSYRNWSKANFGKSEFFGVGWHSTGGEQRGYLKFDLPDINADDLIKARLTLFIDKTIGKNSINIGVYNVLESWEEGSGTYHSGKSEPIDSSGALIWSYQPTFDDSAFAQFRPRKKRTNSIVVDITELVKYWLANNSNYGLLLKPKDSLASRKSTSIYVIYSKEYKNKHPVLKLDIKK